MSARIQRIISAPQAHHRFLRALMRGMAMGITAALWLGSPAVATAANPAQPAELRQTATSATAP